MVSPRDATAAAWIIAGLRGFAESVLSVVPAGFAAYVRIFHPAYRHVEGRLEPVRWAEIASVHNAHAHPGMQLPGISGRNRVNGERPPSDFDRWPEPGLLPPELVGPLATVLRRHTRTPERCWFAVWHGWADVRDDDFIRGSPTFRVPAREYHLLRGPLDAAVGGVLAEHYRSPNLIWPDDRTWCLASEIDFDTTYLGCDETCREDVLAAPELEALAIDPASGITLASDTLNAPDVTDPAES